MFTLKCQDAMQNIPFFTLGFCYCNFKRVIINTKIYAAAELEKRTNCYGPTLRLRFIRNYVS